MTDKEVLYNNLTDNELIDLLFTDEDRLPRAAVDEFVKRGERMIKPLAEIVSVDFKWQKDTPEWWVPIHAVFILGAIGTEETVRPLLKSLRFSAAYDVDWVVEATSSIFGKVGPKALEGLKKIALDETTEWFTRAKAMEGLAAIAIHNPEQEKEIFTIIGSIFCNSSEDKDTRSSAGNVLLDFKREEYRDALLTYGKEERALKDRDLFYNLHFDKEDVLRAFNSPQEDLWHYTKDWLSFYDENEIAKRQERWEREEREELERDEDMVCECDPFTKAVPKVGRNAPCPCGSGKKFKKCCGMEH